MPPSKNQPCQNEFVRAIFKQTTVTFSMNKGTGGSESDYSGLKVTLQAIFTNCNLFLSKFKKSLTGRLFRGISYSTSDIFNLPMRLRESVPTLNSLIVWYINQNVSVNSFLS